MRKPVFGGVRPSKTQTSLLSKETSERLETLGLATIGIILQSSEPQNCLSDCVDAQSDLNLRFSHDVAHLIPNMVTFKKFNPK